MRAPMKSFICGVAAVVLLLSSPGPYISCACLLFGFSGLFVLYLAEIKSETLGEILAGTRRKLARLARQKARIESERDRLRNRLNRLEAIAKSTATEGTKRT